MPKKIVPLAAIDVSKSKTKENDYKLADGDGRYLLVTVSGGKAMILSTETVGYARNTLQSPGQLI